MIKISMPAIREINGDSEMPTKEVNARAIDFDKFRDRRMVSCVPCF